MKCTTVFLLYFLYVMQSSLCKGKYSQRIFKHKLEQQFILYIKNDNASYALYNVVLLTYVYSYNYFPY